MRYLQFFLILLAATVAGRCLAQSLKTVDFYKSIGRHNLSPLWHAKSIQIEGDGEKSPFPEPLGYIGPNYQRFYIHYSPVTQDAQNPYLYHVTGKTRVKDNICRFTGTITVQKAVLYAEDQPPYDPRYKRGYITAQVAFAENPKHPGSGTIKGTLSTDFTVRKNVIQYDAMLAVADGYCNNQCEATWTSYTTRKSKVCNWGDYRMPNSRELDIGAGDVSITGKYISNGWQSFVDAYSADEQKGQRARAIEDQEWWR